MGQFREWFITEAVNPSEIVQLALKARQGHGICDRSRFGDCKDVSQATIALLAAHKIKATLMGGYFLANADQNEEYEHSWIRVGREILDPTIDQFYSSLDVDLVTHVPGIYYSHLNWDGAWLKGRYGKWKH